MIRDLTDNPITNTQTFIKNGQETVFIIKIDCETGYFLSATVNTDIGIFGRLQGDITWVNLETASIDLSSWNGTRRGFEIRLTSPAITQYSQTQFKLKVNRG